MMPRVGEISCSVTRPVGLRPLAASVSRNAANGANLSSRPGVALMIAPPLPWQPRQPNHPPNARWTGYRDQWRYRIAPPLPSQTPSPGSTQGQGRRQNRSEEHTSELQSLMRITYAV